MFILLVDCMDYNIKDPNFQLLGHQQSGLKAGEPAKQLPSQKQPKNLFFLLVSWIGPQWKMLRRFFSQETCYLIMDLLGHNGKMLPCCTFV